MVAGALQSVQELKGNERGAHERILRAAPVRDVQPAGGAQDAMRVGQRGPRGVRREVVQEQRHHRCVDAFVLQLELAGETLAPAHRVGSGLSLCAIKDVGIAIDADELGVRTCVRDR